MSENLIRRGGLHDLPKVHDSDGVGQVLDHRQVVGNEQVSQVQPLLQILHEVEYLGLD